MVFPKDYLQEQPGSEFFIIWNSSMFEINGEMTQLSDCKMLCGIAVFLAIQLSLFLGETWTYSELGDLFAFF